jgi:hypothetical protein
MEVRHLIRHFGGSAVLPVANVGGIKSTADGSIWPVPCLASCLEEETKRSLQTAALYGIVWATPPDDLRLYYQISPHSIGGELLKTSAYWRIAAILFQGSFTWHDQPKPKIVVAGVTLEAELPELGAVVQFSPPSLSEPPHLLLGQMAAFGERVLFPAAERLQSG